MKQKMKMRYLIIFTAFLLLGMIATSCKSPILGEYAANKDVLYFKDFSLSAEPVNLSTNVRGTIFVKGEGEKSDKRHIQISVWVEVDPLDWGGVNFYLPQGWDVTNIASDYPQGATIPERYITTLRAGEEDRSVYIGNSKMTGSSIGGGGEGSVIIDIEPTSALKEMPESLVITVGVGSKGEVISNPVSQKILVPLNVDYRIPGPPTRADMEASSLKIIIHGQSIPLPEDDAVFNQISREAVKIIEGVYASLYIPESDQAKIQKVILEGDYLVVNFNPPAEITTSRIMETKEGRKWETVKLSSAIFFFSGEYYGLIAWPDEERADRYKVYGSNMQSRELEKLVRSVK